MREDKGWGLGGFKDMWIEGKRGCKKCDINGGEDLYGGNRGNKKTQVLFSRTNLNVGMHGVHKKAKNDIRVCMDWIAVSISTEMVS